jgi:adenylate cyclase
VKFHSIPDESDFVYLTLVVSSHTFVQESMKSFKTFWLEFIGDRSVLIREGQSVLHASLAAGIHHYHACGGNGRCSTCRVLVKEGQEYLTPFTEEETLLRRTIPLPDDVRLACQTFVTGSPVKLHRIIRDESDLLLYTEDIDISNQMGEEKELGAFFLDIRNFTPFMESYLPFDVIHILRRLFMLFRKSIESHNGKIIETAGDGLYAVFGFDSNIENAARNGVAAGLSLLEELERFNEYYLNQQFNYRLNVGIGFHAGKVITGNVGLGVNNNVTVMGLPVIIASRLQAATKEVNNSFIISDEVYQMLENPPSVPTTQISLKGIHEQLHVHLIGKGYS